GYYFYSRENEFKILADVFNFFSNAILIVNVDNYQFKILKANAAITNLCGYEVSEIETQNLFDLPFWIDTKIIRIITDFLKSEKDFIKDIILKIKNKENKIITCGLIINCIRDKNRLPIRLHLMMSDITERINYRKQIAMKSAQLEVTNKIIKNMTHTITHKFSNYLSPVLTYINLWLERIEHDKINKNDLLRTFQVLKKILDELNLFIDSSIRLARYDAEIIDAEQIAMKKLFEKSVEILNEFATSKNVKFEINIPDTLTIYGNPFLVSEVIDNLLNNAVKYCNCDSKIICNYKILKNSYTWFSVESAGRPIPREYRSVIFKPYYRMPDAFDQQGDGLGLAICSTIIKHHKGKIGVIPK
ncbi:MAG TPA: HAMP domain-containing sensor histidine kinase, partial [bacterium]|nr:HAMP domain-containing sensor histidine kinase [bacterium]